MFPLVDLTDQTIVIFGASQGIGRATAIMLSRLGARCILIARNETKMDTLLQECEGEGHAAYPFDLNALDAIDSLSKTIVDECGPVDGLVYCAGISDDCPLSLLKPNKVQAVIQVNLEGFFETVRAFTKKKRFNQGMRIVGISSSAAFRGTLAHSAYAASKAGMDGAMRCFAKELAPKGICVNTVAPGMIRTSMYENYLNGCGGEDSAAVQDLLKKQYLGIGEVDDVASAVAFMLSPAARFITGVSLPVDGGRVSN